MLTLDKNLVSDGKWVIEETSFDASQIDHRGSLFLLGNGNYGYRGTFLHDRAKEHVGFIISDTYDNADGKWIELVNAPNALYTELFCNAKPFLCSDTSHTQYRRGLDFKYGQWFWQSESKEIIVQEHRFSSRDSLDLLLSKLTITAKSDVHITLVTGIDDDVWSLHGDHFATMTIDTIEGQMVARLSCVQSKTELEVIKAYCLKRADEYLDVQPICQEGNYVLEIPLKANETLTFEQYVGVYVRNERNKSKDGLSAVAKARLEGYDKLYEKSRKHWDKLWDSLSLGISSDPLADVLLRYNMYQGIICVPLHSNRLPIGARGLSSQAYQGAAFWDQEIFNLPMFLHTNSESAKNILLYRYFTLDGARKKAKNLGFEGAFYAWVSADTGEEICPSFFFIDVLTKRKIRNHFNDWQIHISADIAYAIASYVTISGDYDFLIQYGSEMLFEIARFYCSRAHVSFNTQEAHLLQVLGPDEYHEGVYDNFYTNALVSRMSRYAFEIYEWMKNENPDVLKQLSEKIGLSSEEPAKWDLLSKTLVCSNPDLGDEVIEQFEGYFLLEDITPKELAKRLQNQSEYWGYPSGIAVHTQVTKQADVMQYFMLYPQAASAQTIKKNWDYYERRTQHGSSLSPAVYAITGSRVGYAEKAYEYFLNSCMIDVRNTHKSESGGTYIGGIHTAACGAAWQMVVRGFAGVSATKEGYRFDPHLPEKWSEITFRLVFHHQAVQVTINKSTVTFSCDEKNHKPMVLFVKEDRYELAGGKTVVAPYT